MSTSGELRNLQSLIFLIWSLSVVDFFIETGFLTHPQICLNCTLVSICRQFCLELNGLAVKLQVNDATHQICNCFFLYFLFAQAMI